MKPEFLFKYRYIIPCLYFTVLLCLAPINLLSFDTYYYWEWSRHLALSYYDGSPMIAYFIRLSTALFGSTLFSLSFVGIFVMALTSFIIYKTAELFLSKEASFLAMLSFLFAPLVTKDVVTQTTYDSPLILFWALTLYCTVRFICTNKISSIYLMGASAGLMLLSKYTGIILILSLFIFLISSSYRSLFKNKHAYSALFLALLIFSPVIVWNYQNQWLSFIYQLTTHQLKNSVNQTYAALYSLVTVFIPALNFMLIPPFLRPGVQADNKKALIIRLCRIISIFFLCFYLYAASKTEFRINWLTPYLISSSLLLGYYFEKSHCRKLTLLLISLYGIISLLISIDSTYKYSFFPSKRLVSYHLIKELNTDYPQLSGVILTSGWMEARKMFFLNKQPLVYTLGCGEAPENQYALWSSELKKQIKEKTIKQATYIDSFDQITCLKKYFNQCTRIPTKAYTYRDQEYTLYVYKCTNLAHA